ATTEFSQRGDHGPAALLQRLTTMVQSSCDFEGGAIADEELAVAGRRHSAGRVVGIGAGADDRTVADPARCFPCHPTGRGGGGEIALAITGDSTDGAGLGCGWKALSECSLQFQPALVGTEIAELLESDLLGATEGEGALADQQHMRRVFHHSAR